MVADSLDDVSIATRVIRPDVSVVGERQSAQSRVALIEPPLRLATVMEAETPVHFVEIREVGTMVVVTVIEVLSPTNKAGEGRVEYLRKRRAVLNNDVNLVEIDLLRGGARVPMREPLPDFPYFAIVHRTALRPVADVWPIGFADPLPEIPVPLLAPDSAVMLHLQATLSGAFDSVGYGRAIDYSRSLSPPLGDSEERWARDLLPKPVQ